MPVEVAVRQIAKPLQLAARQAFRVGDARCEHGQAGSFMNDAVQPKRSPAVARPERAKFSCVVCGRVRTGDLKF